MEGWHHCPAPPSLRCFSAEAGRGWVLRLGVWRSDPGRRLGLAAWRHPEGARAWYAPVEGVQKEAWAHQRGKALLLGGGVC